MGKQAGPAEAVRAGQHHRHVQPPQADGALVGCRLALPHTVHALCTQCDQELWGAQMLRLGACSMFWCISAPCIASCQGLLLQHGV